MLSWFPSFLPLLIAVALSTLEFSVGILLFFGDSKKYGNYAGFAVDGIHDSPDALFGTGQSGL